MIEQPLCKRADCNNVTEHHHIKWKGWRNYCSKECENLAKHENMKSTMLLRYGVENSMHRQETKEKIKKTCMEKYGVENAGASKAATDKKMQTILDRYKVNHQMHLTETKEKIKKTCMEKYGVENPSQSDQIKEKVKETNVLRHGVENPFLNPVVQEKIKNDRFEKYKVFHAGQIHISHETLDILNCKEQCTKLFDEGGISNVVSVTGAKRALVYKYLKKHEIVSSTSCSVFEQEIKSFIQGLGFEVTERSRKIIAPLEIDIFIPAINLSIECNGTYWHSELQGKGKSYHVSKTNECRKLGIELIHVWEHDWILRPDMIKGRLLAKCNKANIIYGRNTTISEISAKEASDFLNKNHHQKTCTSSVRLGLFHNSRLVAVMTFGKSRFNKDAEFELLRLCYETGTSVVGGASKLFKYFIRTYKPSSISTYSDRSWNSGSVYSMLGFKYTHTTPPGYKYTSDYLTCENRVSYQKHKLKDKLSEFDPTLTEWQNMKINGYDRIWDCGNDAWIWLT